MIELLKLQSKLLKLLNKKHQEARIYAIRAEKMKTYGDVMEYMLKLNKSGCNNIPQKTFDYCGDQIMKVGK